ncbi:MAG: COX15/CtaA family protein [Planctomycetota bacterium]|nr:COX15/CtaA family protein [Planctomycetota bacterium]
MMSESGRADTAGARDSVWSLALVFGFGGAIAAWIVWFITDLPGVHIPANLASMVIALPLAAAVFLAGRAAGNPGRGALSGLVAGTIAGILGLLRFAAAVVFQPPAGAEPKPGVEGLHPESASMIAAFLGGCAVLGLVFGALGGVFGARREAQRQDGQTTSTSSIEVVASSRRLFQFSVVTAVSFVPLILIGGLVTSTRAGMAVPGWPDSYGANMFLFPQSLMEDPRVFLEHIHRLFGSLIGLTVLVCTAWTFARERRGWIRGVATGVFALVVVQGILGGLRVTEISPYLAWLHGVLGQVVFGSAVALAVFLSPLYAQGHRELGTIAEPLPKRVRRARIFTNAFLHALFLQLVMGAMYRHLRYAGNPGALHALAFHVLFSFVVVVLGVMAALGARAAIEAWKADRAQNPQATLGERVLTVLSGAVLGVLFLQFLLGWFALWAVMTSPDKGGVPLHSELAEAPPIRTWEVLMRTSHQATGAMLLALATALMLSYRRVLKLKKV